jgi:hypothetical protein
MLPVLLPLAVLLPALLTQEVETPAGRPFSLDAAIARGPAVLVFWNSWLPDATSAVPLIEEIDRMAAQSGWPGAVVVFQDESTGSRSPLPTVGKGLPVVLDRRGALLRRFKVTRAPSLVVVDRNGEVLSRAPLVPDQVKAALALLSESPAGAH